MKRITIKSIVFAFLLVCFGVNAQDFQGKAVYQSKTNLDIDFSGSNMPPERIKMIKDRMKQNLERTYELVFDKTASLYTEEEKLDQPTGGGARGGMMIRFAGGGSGKLYKNTQSKSSSTATEFSGKFFLIKDGLEEFDWKMEQESKMIGNYTCFKATAVVQRPVRNMRVSFGRGNRNADNENEEEENNEPEMEDVIITAWYTMDIPVSHGPGNYWGLPGLILEVSDRDTQILCSKIVMNPKEKMEIKEPKKGKVVTQDEYDAIIQEKMEEMRERMRNERQRSGGDRRMIRIGG